MNDCSGTVLNLQRLSTEDGPGLRTTVFFKGCPLECRWCHNPESLLPRVEIQWFSGRCLACGTCIETCQEGNLSWEAETESALHSDNGSSARQLKISRKECSGCGECVENCPAGAIEVLGSTWQAAQLMTELLKDRAYFGAEGGVTLSGGEPTFQPHFAETLLKMLKAAGIHTALDTCGLCAPNVLQRLLRFCDLVMYDLKILDEEQHRLHTGKSNQAILDNLNAVVMAVRSGKLSFGLWVRTPLIPGAIATAENIRAIGEYLRAHTDGVLQRWELCAFNNLCRDQYDRLERPWRYAATPLMSQDELAEMLRVARSSGVDPELILVTGASRVTAD